MSAPDAATEKEVAAFNYEEESSRHPVALVQLAHDADALVYSPWSKGLLKLYAVLFLPYLCGCLNGYDGSLMGGIIAMDSYQSVFGM